MRVNLRKSLFILPNLFTLSSVFCGFYAIVLCSAHPAPSQLDRAALLIVFAMFFDIIDGRVARLTRTQSAIGVQLDSLADLVSFGVAPAMLVYRWSLESLGTFGLIASFVYIACGAIRLARFNVLTSQAGEAPKKPGKYVVGLPIPAAAGFLVSLVGADHRLGGVIASTPVLVAVVFLALCVFMVSTIRFRSLKDLKPSKRTALLVTSVMAAITVVALRSHVSIALLSLLAGYLFVGLVETCIGLSRRRPKKYRELMLAERGATRHRADEANLTDE